MSRGLNVCGATRLLIPAFFVGMAITAFTGNETLAWIIAGSVAATIWATDRVRGRSATCAVPVRTTAEPTDTVESDSTTRVDTSPTDVEPVPSRTDTVPTKG